MVIEHLYCSRSSDPRRFRRPIGSHSHCLHGLVVLATKSCRKHEGVEYDLFIGTWAVVVQVFTYNVG